MSTHPNTTDAEQMARMIAMQPMMDEIEKEMSIKGAILDKLMNALTDDERDEIRRIYGSTCMNLMEEIMKTSFSMITTIPTMETLRAIANIELEVSTGPLQLWNEGKRTSTDAETWGNEVITTIRNLKNGSDDDDDIPQLLS